MNNAEFAAIRGLAAKVADVSVVDMSRIARDLKALRKVVENVRKLENDLEACGITPCVQFEVDIATMALNSLENELDLSTNQEGE